MYIHVSVLQNPLPTGLPSSITAKYIIHSDGNIHCFMEDYHSILVRMNVEWNTARYTEKSIMHGFIRETLYINKSNIQIKCIFSICRFIKDHESLLKR